MKVRDSILEKLNYSDSDWERQLLVEKGKSSGDHKKELAAKIFYLLEGYHKLKTVNLSDILKNIAGNRSGDEYQTSLENIFRLNPTEFNRALEKLGIPNPLFDVEGESDSPQDQVAPKTADEDIEPVTTSADISADDDLLIAPSEHKGGHNVMPKGYKVWTAHEFEAHENKIVAYWTVQGEYGKGEFFIHTKKRHEFCFRPEGGRLVVLTEAHKRRLSPEGSNYRFKALRDRDR